MVVVAVVTSSEPLIWGSVSKSFRLQTTVVGFRAMVKSWSRWGIYGQCRKQKVKYQETSRETYREAVGTDIRLYLDWLAVEG